MEIDGPVTTDGGNSANITGNNFVPTEYAVDGGDASYSSIHPNQFLNYCLMWERCDTW